MKSIKNHILRRLLIGQGFLWLIAAAAVWYSQRARLISEFDSEIKLVASALRFHVRGNENDLNQVLEERWPQFLDQNSGWYFQAWKDTGEVESKSKTLGGRNLHFPFDAAKQYNTSEKVFRDASSFVYKNFQGESGIPIRGVTTFRNVSQRRSRWERIRQEAPETLILLVAQSRVDLNRELLWLAIGVIFTGILASTISATLIRQSIRKGLLPLFQMGEQAAAIDVSSLDIRFEGGSMPKELEPISSGLNILLDRLEDGFTRERRFSSDLAHEIRTPVAEMKAVAELLVKWPEEADESRFQKILKSSNRIEGIVDCLTLLSQWESGNEPVNSEKVTIRRFVEESWEALKDKADKQSIQLECDIKRKEITTNPELFRLILNNLMSNAIEYAKEGTRFLVKCTGDSPAILEFTNHVENFDPNQIQHLAERFWRADNVRTSGGHFGLGLSIVESCAERLGWKMDIDYEEVAGLLTFRLTEKS